MQSVRWLAPILGAGMIACGGRVSVGDLGGPSDSKAGGTASGDSTSSGSSTPGSSAGGAAGTNESSATSGTSGSLGSSGSRPTSQQDGGGGAPIYIELDAAVSPDVANIGATACGGVEYPATAFYGENILYPPYTKVTPGAQIEMAAKLGSNAAVRIKMTLLNGSPWFIGGLGTDWRTTQFDFGTGVQIFQAPDPGRTVEETFTFLGSGAVLIEYFECGSATATGTKVLVWGNAVF